MIQGGDRNWAKLCFEYSPQGQPMVVSVVTRGVSDDANSMPIDAKTVWLPGGPPRLGLRIPRLDRRNDVAVHPPFAPSSREVTPQVGFVAQSPTGEGCSVTFEDIRFEPRRLPDLRNGD